MHIGLEDSLAPVVELAVSDQNAEPACRDEIAMIPRQRVDGAAYPDHVVGPGHLAPLSEKAKRERGVDVGDAMISVLPSFQLSGQTDRLRRSSLFEVDDVAI